MGRFRRRRESNDEPDPSPQPDWTPPPPLMSVDELLPDLPDYDPGPADGVRVGESPVPGVTLKRILRGHTGEIYRIAWSPDGRFLASPSEDRAIRIWDVARGECVALLGGHNGEVYSVTWSPDGWRLASGSGDKTVRIWDAETWKLLTVLEDQKSNIYSIAWNPKHDLLASGSQSADIGVWDLSGEKLFRHFKGSKSWISSLVWSGDGQNLISGSGYGDNSIRLWDVNSGNVIRQMGSPGGTPFCIVWFSPNNLAIGCDNGNVYINVIDENLIEFVVFEGHSSRVSSVSYHKGGLLASKGDDGIVHIWDLRTRRMVARFSELPTELSYATQFTGLAFHPYLPILATLGEKDTVIRIWEIDEEVLLSQASTDSVRYTTAKLVLVGDSGVGKTGLGWRLAHGEFKEHSSTHGQQFWVVDELGKTRDDGTQCEAVLWDLAGQHVYRQVHSIFLDDVDASLVLFDPTNRQDPLKGTEFWLEQLKGKGELPPSVLIGARMDRGGLSVSEDYLAQFCQQHGISGGYIGTSAKEGIGLADLLDILKDQIPWDSMTTTVTTITFKRIKDYVLALKEEPDRARVLVHPAELRAQLQDSDPEWDFTDAEMMTAVGHLQNHGYVTILTSSSGETHILLTPDLLVDLASSIVLQADKHPRELGAVSETDLLEDCYEFDELDGLDDDERHILLDAAVLLFLEHNVCFREMFDSDTLLIFPGLIKQKRPLVDDFPATDDVSYVVRGRVENLYAMLVVLLGYTPSFVRINQWQNQAQYEMGDGEICGFHLIADREGEIELVLYYSEQMPAYGRARFQELFERFLYQRDVDVTRFPPVICGQGHRLDRATVVNRIRDGKDFAFCAECGNKVMLPELDKPDIDIPDWLKGEEAAARLRSLYEAHLLRVKGYRRDWEMPRCYLSHAPSEASYADKLMHDLQEAGIYVIADAGQVEPDDYVVVLDTAAYQRAYRNPPREFEAEADLVSVRLGSSTRRLASITLENETGPTPDHDLMTCNPGDFSNVTHYPVSLFNLVLKLYAIPFDHAAFVPHRQSLHRQWEETLGGLSPKEIRSECHARPLQLFISYAHEDEAFKDDLVIMLAGLQRRGVIDAWQDGRIQPGDEWYPAIQTAMNECDLALLLVSSDFIDSRFIQEDEVPHLLQRRKDEGMRVIPIIIRPCMWDSEPVLSDLQALPKDAQPVITFPVETGERDQVWTDIAKVIERRAEELRGA